MNTLQIIALILANFSLGVSVANLIWVILLNKRR